MSPTYSFWSNEGPGTASIKFAIRYEVAGKIYWDNNGGWDYCCGCWSSENSVVLGPNLLLKSAAVTEDNTTSDCLEGEVFVKNLGRVKQVELVYTTDRWAHAQRVAASLRKEANNNVGNPNELWTFTAPLGQLADLSLQVRFALRCQVNGAVYWDNNMGHDYVISKGVSFDRV